MPVPQKTTELVDALRLQMNRTQVQPGCHQCRISLDTEETNILYQEEWDSWEAVEKHIRSERFAWILELLDQSTDTPDLNFCDVHETRGIDYVRKLRTVNKR